MVWIKMHRTPDGGLLLAGCDEHLAGQVFEEGNKVLDVKKTFFAEEQVSNERFIELMQQATTFNIIGKEIVDVARDAGMIQDVRHIDSVVFAQGVNLRA